MSTKSRNGILVAALGISAIAAPQVSAQQGINLPFAHFMRDSNVDRRINDECAWIVKKAIEQRNRTGHVDIPNFTYTKGGVTGEVNVVRVENEHLPKLYFDKKIGAMKRIEYALRIDGNIVVGKDKKAVYSYYAVTNDGDFFLVYNERAENKTGGVNKKLIAKFAQSVMNNGDDFYVDGGIVISDNTVVNAVEVKGYGMSLGANLMLSSNIGRRRLLSEIESAGLTNFSDYKKMVFVSEWKGSDFVKGANPDYITAYLLETSGKFTQSKFELFPSKDDVFLH